MSNLFIYIIIGGFFVFGFVFFLVKKKRARSSKNNAQSYPANQQLYIGNLSYQMGNRDLRDLFSKYGEIQTVRLIKNNKTGRSKGFAFVTYFTVQDARKALTLNGETIQGRAIVVRMAKPRES